MVNFQRKKIHLLVLLWKLILEPTWVNIIVAMRPTQGRIRLKYHTYYVSLLENYSTYDDKD